MVKMDLKLERANLVNVFTSEIYATNIYINDGLIWGFDGEYEAKKTINCEDKFITPSFIEGHIHIESSHVRPDEFSYHLLKNGVTSVVCDPHEIANVGGLDGIKYLIENTKNLPIDFYFSAPSCVPASKFDTVKQELDRNELRKLKKFSNVIGLGEVMDFPAVINRSTSIMKKISEFEEYVIDGHSPGLSGKELDSYIRAGIYSDHECVKIEEAKEKMRKGMYIMIREASSAKNMDLTELLNDVDSNRYMFVTDDISPKDLYSNKFILKKLRKALNTYNISPVELIKGLTINPATYFDFNEIGAVAPGFKADLIIFDDIKSFDLNRVIKEGKTIYKKKNKFFGFKSAKTETEKKDYKNNLFIKKFSKNDFKIKDKNKKVRVLKIVEDSIITEEKIIKMPSQEGFLQNDFKNDIIKISHIERYTGKSQFINGFIKGTNLKKGALATSYNHDSHNIFVIGTNDEDMAFAVNKLKEMGGGIVYVKNQTVIEKLPLPIYGVISNKHIKEVSKRYSNLEKKLKDNGVKLENPLDTLSFMSLTVIPKIKISNKGLIDVDKFKVVDLYV